MAGLRPADIDNEQDIDERQIAEIPGPPNNLSTRWKDSSNDGGAPSPVRNSLTRPTIACSVCGPPGFVGLLLPAASALLAERFRGRCRRLRGFLGLLLRLLFLGGELCSLVLFPRGFVSHVSAPAAREIGVATETNARTDRWWAPRHSDRPVTPTLLRQATRISTEKSTRRPADLDEVTVGIAEEHADLVMCQNSAESPILLALIA